MIREIIVWLVAVPICIFIVAVAASLIECARQERNDPRDWR